MPFEYLILMGLCLLITLPLELFLGARVYRRPRLVLRAILPVIVIFAIWDLVGIQRGHWHFNPAKVTGLELPGGMPIEELVFFIVIPLCALLTFEAVGTILAKLRGEPADG
ncbi:MAG: lycopene cyclase domain-containing protein [Propionibacteriaceae bacterium]|nr:lycopene cyclase domain-containing protein [Propionibacteriaceae bacterium]